MTEFSDPAAPETTYTRVVDGTVIDLSVQEQVAADASAAAASAAASAAAAASVGTGVSDAAASAAAASASATAASGSATAASGSASVAFMSASAAATSAGAASASAAAAAASAASLHGVIAGGTIGQALVKASNTDYDLAWGNVDLTNLNATNLTSGTVPDARFPATLPAASGVNLTALNATNLGSGTVPDARFPATLPAASGVNLTALNASNLGSGTVPTARLGSGTANSTTVLRGDNTWGAPASATVVLLSGNYTVTSASYQDVTGMTFSVVAGTYYVTGHMFGQGDGTHTLQFALNVSANLTSIVAQSDAGTNTPTTITAVDTVFGGAPAASEGGGPFSAVIVVSGAATVALRVRGNGGTSGTVFGGTLLAYQKIA